MKAPMSWLRHLVAADLDTATTATKFTALGLTVEHITTTGPEVSGPLTVGQVLSFVEEPQKNGKTIRYCRVDVGDQHNDAATGDYARVESAETVGEPSVDDDTQGASETDAGDTPSGTQLEGYPASRGIVCGALNFAIGDLVVVALPGTVLPGGFEISARKTYGHLSDGMICAEDELGLGEDHDGIMILDPQTGAKPGDDALALLWTSDDVLEMDITPDLGYALSMRGLAREAAAFSDAPFEDPYSRRLPEPVATGYPVVVESDRCASFVALSIIDFDPSAPSPKFMVDRLRASGVRSISLPVDVTNYVMLESGQPLHAYDAAKLSGPIRVRMAQQDESLTTLDGVTRKLDSDDLLITDDSGPIGLAGVMGGETTEVAPDTAAVVLEAANFDPGSVSRTFRRHGLPSEASKRFERTVDPNLGYAAARRAAELLVAHGGGRILGEETVVGAAPAQHRLNLRTGLIPAILGADVTPEQSVDILESAGVNVTALGDSLSLTIPSWRNDLRDPYDIVEEVGSKFGYEKIGLRLPVAPPGRGLTQRQQNRRAIMRSIVDLGFSEVLSLPFISEQELDSLGLETDDPRRSTVKLANPLDETKPFLRTSLLPGLFAAVARNTSRNLEDLAIFERGLGYFDFGTTPAPRVGVTQRPSQAELAAFEAALPQQPEAIAAVVCGDWLPANWQHPAVPADWTHVVALAETAATTLGIQLQRRNAQVMPWHPGRCAELAVEGRTLGFAGELHPDVIKAYGLPERTCAVEFNLTDLLAAAPAGGTIGSLSGYPLAKEDVALIVAEEVPAAAVEQALIQGAGDLLESVALFDIFRGDQIGEGKKSLAFALRFRAERTLTDEDAAGARDAAVAVAVEQFGAVQRV